MNINNFLENSVYYPACRFDGRPIRFLSKLFSNYIYSDYLTEHEDLEKKIARNGLKGYQLIESSFIEAEELFGVSWDDYLDNNREISKKLIADWVNPYAKFYTFERNSDLDDNHGRENINLLYIKSEGICAYKYLYVNRDIVPQCLVSIMPGWGFGCNFNGYIEIFSSMVESSGKLPKYMLYREEDEDGFYPLLNLDHYKKIDNFYSFTPGYNWEHHFNFMEKIC
jgi:hypothetical protein